MRQGGSSRRVSISRLDVMEVLPLHLWLPTAIQFAAIGGPATAALFIADVATKTTVFNRTNLEVTEMSRTPEFLTVPSFGEPTPEEMSQWDDIDGLDLDGYVDDVEFTGEPWLASLLYSDYASAADDDDRPRMDIPAHVLEVNATPDIADAATDMWTD
ncbi:hypothetical protein SEA_JOIEB_112 [Mycobacterium phage JoieB]|uniref:Uncharacterized protein n=2 Tax=Marvinvirus marvin TaxID=1982092 RepID=A0A5P8DD88_9CAUD|nr:hypothetical protein SEA_JOIEB_112 [Mycobacterium phage JoieB]QFP96968.1 hypothetical protein SEA_PRINGAR_107 [Mycobacterium phage Pringar]